MKELEPTASSTSMQAPPSGSPSQSPEMWRASCGQGTKTLNGCRLCSQPSWLPKSHCHRGTFYGSSSTHATPRITPTSSLPVGGTASGFSSWWVAARKEIPVVNAGGRACAAESQRHAEPKHSNPFNADVLLPVRAPAGGGRAPPAAVASAAQQGCAQAHGSHACTATQDAAPGGSVPGGSVLWVQLCVRLLMDLWRGALWVEHKELGLGMCSYEGARQCRALLGLCRYGGPKEWASKERVAHASEHSAIFSLSCTFPWGPSVPPHLSMPLHHCTLVCACYGTHDISHVTCEGAQHKCYNLLAQGRHPCPLNGLQSHTAALAQERNAIATICLRKRAIPARDPPRIIVFTGPGAVGRSTLMRRLVEEFSDKFGLTVSTTSRRPREHELRQAIRRASAFFASRTRHTTVSNKVHPQIPAAQMPCVFLRVQVHGVNFYFTNKAAMRAQQAAGEFLELAPVESLYRGRPLPTRRRKQRTSKRGPLSEAGVGPLDGPLVEEDEEDGDEHQGEEEGAEEESEDEETETYLYGTSIANVRNVAATGKLCVMSVEEQGVAQLQANKRIDGLYIYVAPPSLEDLAARMRGRLKEAESTIQLRLEWAKAQIAENGAAGTRVQKRRFAVHCKHPEEAAHSAASSERSTLNCVLRWLLHTWLRHQTPASDSKCSPGTHASFAQASKPGAYDHMVQNTQFPMVYHGIKEAISTLSPIIRNRLRGLPAYVLDYSDLIPPNLVEKPFLKPVIVSGPHTGKPR
eukprot:1160936-Pelagomonas_calceolata.AAC.2